MNEKTIKVKILSASPIFGTNACGPILNPIDYPIGNVRKLVCNNVETVYVAPDGTETLLTFDNYRDIINQATQQPSVMSRTVDNSNTAKDDQKNNFQINSKKKKHVQVETLETK